MSDLDDTHTAIAEYAGKIRLAQMQLRGLILGVCPGPHRFMQRLDGRAPWCGACRYTADGERLPEPGRTT